jgi:hypothetical protein
MQMAIAQRCVRELIRFWVSMGINKMH